ncbi:MAG: Spy/CpxP family protein refolding chaperone [Geobacteraceae bacterium]|nr:Spy/CpxP family protein refolding chaperone [Geobacteraceae bacterium]
MRRPILMVSLLSATLLSGVAGAHAATPPDAPKTLQDKQKGDEMPPGKGMPPQMFAAQGKNSPLHLNGDQEKKIAEILTSEQKKIAPLLKKQDEIRQRLMQAERATNFDETALRVIAGDLAKTEAELIVSHVKTNRQITAILTPEQRDILLQLETERNHHPAHPRPPKGPNPDTRHER